MFTLTIVQVVKLFIFILLGFLLVKVKVMYDESAKVMSRLVLYLFTPALSFQTFANNLTPEKLLASGELMITAVVSTVAACVIGTIIGRRCRGDTYSKNVIVYSMNVPNFGYMAYPLCLALFGDEALMQLQMFCIPFSVYVYTEGYRLLLNRPMSLKSFFINPPIIAMFLGGIVGLLKIPVPSLINGVLTDLSGCMAVSAMVLTGATIARFNVRDIVADRNIYITLAVRMIAIPLLVFAAGKLVGLSQNVMRIMMCLFAMPVGLNGVVYPSTIGEDCRLGAGLACVANVVAIITIPLLLSLVV